MIDFPQTFAQYGTSSASFKPASCVLRKKLCLMVLSGLPDDGIGHCEFVARGGDGGEAQIVAVEVNDLPAIHRVDGTVGEPERSPVLSASSVF